MGEIHPSTGWTLNHLNITVHSESVGLQVFDKYYAYRQSCNAHKNYQSDITITFGNPVKGACNLLYAYMPVDQVDTTKHDLVFYENCSEGLEVATQQIHHSIQSDPRQYFLCGAYLTKDHPSADKIIPWSLCHALFIDRYTRGFYPAYFDRAQHKVYQRDPVWYINGQRRAWRHQALQAILRAVPRLPVRDSISQQVWPIEQCFFESSEDTNARLQLNSDATLPDETLTYYADAVPVGIDQKFGTIAPGWFVLPEYYQYHCTVFPESNWINNQIQPNEKFFKCCVAETIPMPVGGANINRLYQHLGYQTAWNLLPPELQQYDQELDHLKRYSIIADAVQWLANNPGVFLTRAAQRIRQNNKLRVFESTVDLHTMHRLDEILANYFTFTL